MVCVEVLRGYSMRVRYKCWTKACGIGGLREKPEDFAVREIIHPIFLRKSSEGKYTLFLVKKRNMTTHEAIKKLASLGFVDIGYAGLKDKFAVTWQYMSAMAEPKKYEIDNLEVVPVGSSRKLLPGDLLGNVFAVTLHDCENIEKLPLIIKELLDRGMPNYFGMQRFGRYGKNLEIGKHLVKRNFRRALKMINKQSRGFRSINNVPKQQLRFMVNAYQSWIFNQALNAYIDKYKKPYFTPAPLVGYNTHFTSGIMDSIIRNICSKEAVAAADFRINELMMTCLGDRRNAFIRLTEIDYSLGRDVKLAFTLPKGSYATVLLREICKKESTEL